MTAAANVGGMTGLDKIFLKTYAHHHQATPGDAASLELGPQQGLTQVRLGPERALSWPEAGIPLSTART